MTETNGQPAAGEPRVEVSEGWLQRGGVIVRESKKKGKRRYSKSLKGIQKKIDGLTRVSSRVTTAIAKGMQEYRDRSDRSSKKKKDGMLRDLLQNSARGLEATLRVSSKLPGDFVRVLRPKWVKR